MARPRTRRPSTDAADRAARIRSLESQLKRRDAAIAELEGKLAKLTAGSTPPAALAEIANRTPTDDPLAANATMYELLVAACREVAVDKNLSARDRLLELRTTAAAAAKLLPRTRLFQAEQLVIKNQGEIAKKRNQRAAGKLQPRAPRAT